MLLPTSLEIKFSIKSRKGTKIQTKKIKKVSKTLQNKSFLTSFFRKIRFLLKISITLITSKITIKNKKLISLSILFIINIKMLTNLLNYIKKSKKNNLNNVHSIQKLAFRTLKEIMISNNFTKIRLNILKKLLKKSNN